QSRELSIQEPGSTPDRQVFGPRPAERRQMTVMTCHVIGVAALAGCLDPEDLRGLEAAWQRCCADVIETHSGYIASYAIDGLVAWFGFPHANEDDAERAVRGGLAVSDAVSKVAIGAGEPLRLSVGIATGVVVVDAKAANGAQAANATGSTLHL